MANSSSGDEADALPERPTRIQPYQFEPVRQDFQRVPEDRVKESHVTDGEPETIVSASLQKIKSIKNPIKRVCF